MLKFGISLKNMIFIFSHDSTLNGRNFPSIDQVKKHKNTTLAKIYDTTSAKFTSFILIDFLNVLHAYTFLTTSQEQRFSENYELQPCLRLTNTDSSYTK